MLKKHQNCMSHLVGCTTLASQCCLAFFAQQDMVITDDTTAMHSLLKAFAHDTACMVHHTGTACTVMVTGTECQDSSLGHLHMTQHARYGI